MVIRLYLGMLESNVAARTARMKIRETLEVVDRTIEGIRRIIGRLSPLVLQELGLDCRHPQGSQGPGEQCGSEGAGHGLDGVWPVGRRCWRLPSTAWCRKPCTTSPNTRNATTVTIEMTT